MTAAFPIHPSLPLLEKSLERRGLTPPAGWRYYRLPFAPHGAVGLYIHPSLEGRHPTYLIHTAFLTELLARVLDKEEGVWQIPDKPPGPLVPDAILYRGNHRIAVEVDLFYTRAKLLRKVRYYAQAYDAQIWGVSAKRRETYLRAAAWPKPIQVHHLSPKEVLL